MRALFPPNTAAWDELATRIRLDVFDAAVREHVDLILTRVPRDAGPAEVARVSVMIAPIREAGGQGLFVQLACAREALYAWVGRDERRAHDKRTDPAVPFARSDLEVPPPFAPHLRLDLIRLPPTEAAEPIAAHSALPGPPSGESDRRVYHGTSRSA